MAPRATHQRVSRRRVTRVAICLRERARVCEARLARRKEEGLRRFARQGATHEHVTCVCTICCKARTSAAEAASAAGHARRAISLSGAARRGAAAAQARRGASSRADAEQQACITAEAVALEWRGGPARLAGAERARQAVGDGRGWPRWARRGKVRRARAPSSVTYYCLAKKKKKLSGAKRRKTHQRTHLSPPPTCGTRCFEGPRARSAPRGVVCPLMASYGSGLVRQRHRRPQRAAACVRPTRLTRASWRA